MKSICLIPLLLLLFSCKNEKEQQLKRDIVGEWEFVKYLDSTKRKFDGVISEETVLFSNFSCFKDGSYLKNNGFWNMPVKQGAGDRYCGWYSRYGIEKDSMCVFIPGTGSCIKTKIFTLKNDTLIYSLGNKRYALFKRAYHKLNPGEQYDAIEVNANSVGDINGFSTITITRLGNIYLEGGNYSTGADDFTASISPGDFLKLQDEFKKSGVDVLDTLYKGEYYRDTLMISVSFIKNGSVCKTITDYGGKSPQAFQDAYKHACFMYQILKLKNAHLNCSEFLRWNIEFYNFNKQHLTLNWNTKDQFVSELNKAKPSNHLFSTKYRMKYGFFKKDNIVETDGRYYKFPPEDGGKTLDLGYNFIERNNLEKQFVENE